MTGAASLPTRPRHSPDGPPARRVRTLARVRERCVRSLLCAAPSFDAASRAEIDNALAAHFCRRLRERAAPPRRLRRRGVPAGRGSMRRSPCGGRGSPTSGRRSPRVSAGRASSRCADCSTSARRALAPLPGGRWRKHAGRSARRTSSSWRRRRATRCRSRRPRHGSRLGFWNAGSTASRRSTRPRCGGRPASSSCCAPSRRRAAATLRRAGCASER